MDSLSARTQELFAELASLWRSLDLDNKINQLEELDKQLSDPDVWQDNQRAQELSKNHSKLQQATEPWLQLKKELADISELCELGDSSLASELDKQLIAVSSKLTELKRELRFNGPFDDSDCVVGIYAGAGGTDAQDWAAMLFRMYTRWAEQNHYKVRLDDESAGEEAGIKSVVLEISGPNAYGKLKAEHGVHRLVRLSPFNSDNLRQTSFAKVEVVPKIDKPETVEIDSSDLKIDVYRSGGHGGQSVNTTDSAVRVTHIPTGIVVAIQNERSQLQNKETALSILRGKLAQLQLEQHQDDIRKLKGPNEQASWGNQIRSYVLHPYKQVKDLRTGHLSTDPDEVLDGALNSFIDSYLEFVIQ